MIARTTAGDFSRYQPAHDRIALPPGISGYTVEKGSIAVEGISLTIARWEPESGENGVIEIAVIPHTYARTNLLLSNPAAC